MLSKPVAISSARAKPSVPFGAVYSVVLKAPVLVVGTAAVAVVLPVVFRIPIFIAAIPTDGERAMAVSSTESQKFYPD